ncbi:MAG TPA: J domain-containing protein [Rhodospirillaceae bacterium]|nr:J domain-containing protein [Rhodospirillaceae bacterium]
MAKPDLYEILGIARNADTASIKAAYRKLAKIRHPDAGGDPEAFRLLKLAHDILSDPARRALYDETGQAPEPVNTPDEDHRLNQAVSDLFFGVMLKVKNPQNEDVVLLMRAAANDRIRYFSGQISVLREVVDKIDLAISQIHAVAGDNRLKEVAIARRDYLSKAIDNMISEQNLYAGILHFLDGYTFDVKEYFKYVSIDP